MTTSLEMLWKSASSLEDKQIEPATIGYFHGLSQDEAHELVLSIFLALAESDGVTRALIARRLNKSPEQVTRWLSAPGNWTLDTYTNLLLAMGYRPLFGAERLRDMRQSNEHHPAVGRAMRDGLGIKIAATPRPAPETYRLSMTTDRSDDPFEMELSLSGAN